MFRIDIQSTIGEVVGEMADRLADLTPPMKTAADTMLDGILETFRTERDPYGEKWRPFSQTTLELYAKGGLFGRQRAGGKRSLLRGNTGALFASFSRKFGKNFSQVASGGQAIPYNAVQQFGNPNNRLPNVSPQKFAAKYNRTARRNFPPRAPIPARPFMPLRPDGKTDLPAEQLDDIMDEIAIYVERGT